MASRWWNRDSTRQTGFNVCGQNNSARSRRLSLWDCGGGKGGWRESPRDTVSKGTQTPLQLWDDVGSPQYVSHYFLSQSLHLQINRSCSCVNYNTTPTLMAVCRQTHDQTVSMGHRLQPPPPVRCMRHACSSAWDILTVL